MQKIQSLLTEELQSWFELAVKNLPNLAVALIVFVIFYFLAKITARVFGKVVAKITSSESVQNLLTSIVKISVIVVGLFIALGILDLDKTVTSLLAGAGVIGLALGFAFQDITANFISGILIAFNKPYRMGDIVEVGDYLGKVTSIDLRTTTITTFQGIEALVPNRMLFTDPIKNYTNIPERRIDLAVGVSYGDDLSKVEAVLLEGLQDLPNRLKTKDIDVFFTGFGGSSIDLEVRIWVQYSDHRSYLVTRSEAIKLVKTIFDDNDIMIPFPIRTLDFGIRGGEKLSEMNLDS
ncbi:mechanosensitive ion channel family protein [Thalassoroseus pseudoceratinae]|uniref:mechanosensitive ion channel family protein n=1 Tax=Thalassoroseus pseudoceratinae TaxID=2713176 RepID=UPI001981DE7E|nr:mechanosensitive ion channel family protein [Thalassoroseus pseudoceratinae]